MSKLSITNAEKRLLLHIQLGGTVTDEVGIQLVANFALTAAGDGQIAKIATQYKISTEDILLIYVSAIHALMPNPCICDGGPIQIENRVGSLLVPTLFFMEPHRFQGLAREISIRTQGMDDLARKSVIAELAARDANIVQQVHDQNFGPAKFHIESGNGLKSAKGCLVILGFIVALAGGIHGLTQIAFG